MASEKKYLGLSSRLYTHVPTKCSYGHTYTQTHMHMYTPMHRVDMHPHTQIITVWPMKTSVHITESALNPQCNKFWSKQE